MAERLAGKRVLVTSCETYMGPAIAGILTGSVVVEQIFGIPGLGQRFVLGAISRDYTLVLGIVIFYAALIILLNLLVDISYAFLDPRVRLDGDAT